jgi:hypothetical protein
MALRLCPGLHQSRQHGRVGAGGGQRRAELARRRALRAAVDLAPRWVGREGVPAADDHEHIAREMATQTRLDESRAVILHYRFPSQL